MKLLNIILALLLISVPAVSGELIINKHTNDFVLSSPNNEQLKLCSCETRVDTIIVENIGNFYSSYSLWIESEWPGSAYLGESTFNLAPKEFREIPVYISDSCDITGEFDYTVYATNNFGREESLYRSIRSDYCESSRVEVSDDVEIGLCEPAEFDVTVTNVGRHAETYTIDIHDHHEYADIPVPEVYLQPDESFQQTVTLQWPCDDYGEKHVQFIVTTEKSDTETIVDRYVTIANEYEFNLDIGTEMTACALTTTHVPLGIENAIDIEEEVWLDIDGPGFVTFENGERAASVILPAGETVYVNLEISPEMEGEHTVTIDAQEIYGGSEKTRDITLNVEMCYDAAVELRHSSEEPITGPIRDCCGLKTYFVNVHNQADREQVFQLDVEGPSFFLLDERTVRVQPSQSVNVPLYADLPCSDDAYDALVRVYPVGQPELNVTADLTVESLTMRTCHMVQIDDDELVVSESDDTIPVIIRHTGLQGGVYDLKSNSSLVEFTQDTILLQPGDERTLYLTPITDLTEEEKGRHLLFPVFTHQDNGIMYNEFVGVELEGKGLIERFLDWLFGLDFAAWAGCSGWVLFLIVLLVILLIVLILMWLGVINPFRKGLRPGLLGLLRTLIVVALLVLIVVLLLLPTPDRAARYQWVAEGNATVLEWYQDETLTVDLDQYFEDPDMDDLSYSATQPNNIRADIDDNELTLTPDNGWTGNNTMILTAEDGKSGEAMSPTFILRVIPEQELTCPAWMNLWCWHLIILLLIAILIVLFLMLLGVRERRQDLKSENVVVVVPPAEKRVRKRRKTVYYSSKTGTKAHLRGCMALRDVKKSNRVTHKSKTAVLNAGLALCSMCTKAPVRKKESSKPRKKRTATKAAATAVSTKKRPRKVAQKKASKKTTRKSAKRVTKKTAKRSRKVTKRSKTTKRRTVKRRKAVPVKKSVPAKRPVKRVKAVPIKKAPAKKQPPAKKQGEKTVNIQVNIAQD